MRVLISVRGSARAVSTRGGGTLSSPAHAVYDMWNVVVWFFVLGTYCCFQFQEPLPNW